MKTRLPEYDILRVIAALSVIAIHVTAGYVYNSTAGFVWNQAMRNSVPLFVIMSGYLLYHGDMYRWLPLKQFYSRRFSRVLIPYIIWTIIYVILTDIILNSATPRPGVLLTNLAEDLLYGTGFFHLYFLIIIFQLYLLYPLLRTWLKNHSAGLLFIAFVLTLAAQTIIYLSEMKLIILPHIGFLYSSLFPVWLFYFIFGMKLAQNHTWFANRINLNITGTGIIFFLSLGVVIFDSIYTSTPATSIKPSIMIYTLVSYFFFYVLARHISTYANLTPIFRRLADQSFLIFLLHPFILTLLSEMVWIPGLSQLWQGNTGMVALYLITVILTIGLSYLISLTPLAKILGGASSSKH